MAYYCPQCTTEQLTPARFQWFEFPLLAFLCRPYECPHCFGRFMRPFWR